MRVLDLLRRAAGRPPSYLLKRAMLEAGRLIRAGPAWWRLRHLTAAGLAREAGFRSLANFWRERAAGFLYSSHDRDELRRLYCTSYAAEGCALQGRIQQVLEHEFDLLGSGRTNLGPHIDWHLDFKSGRRWDLRPAGKINYAELDQPSDVKVPWELSRGYQLVTLGQGWLLNGDERTVHEFAAQVHSWILANPVGHGINWACTMEVALRAVNWIWAGALFADAPLADGFWDEMLLSLYQHGLWIPEHLEIAQVNGNHFTANALGLVACGSLFLPLREAQRWFEQGSRLLEEQIRLQVDEDGVDIEASTAYHRLVLEMFLVAARFMESGGRTPSRDYRAKIGQMIDFVHACTPAQGPGPVVGDADDGRVVRFAALDPGDQRCMLSTGCALYGRADWRQRSGRYYEDSLWLLGPSSARRYHEVQVEEEEKSCTFPASGFHILRSSRQYLFIDAGPVGFCGLGGHGHNDCLGFEWHVDGHPLLTDSGLFVYTASPMWRDLYRSTAFHNTIRVDGEEINRFLSPPTLWFLGNDAQPIDVRFRCVGECELLETGHTGYRRLPDPVTVRRTFEMNLHRPVLRLMDSLEGREEHSAEFYFHAAPGARFSRLSDDAVEFRWSGCSLQIVRLGDVECLWAEKEGWFSPSYGVKILRPVALASIRTRLPFHVAWEMTVSAEET